MPLADGTLTQEEFARVQETLLSHWAKAGGRPNCRACGSNRYFIHPSLLGNRSDTLSPNQPHTRLPTVGVYCASCGHLEQHVARVLGIQVLLPVPPLPPVPKTLGEILGEALEKRSDG